MRPLPGLTFNPVAVLGPNLLARKNPTGAGRRPKPRTHIAGLVTTLPSDSTPSFAWPCSALAPPEAAVATPVHLRLPRPWQRARRTTGPGLLGSPIATTHAYDAGRKVRDKEGFLFPKLCYEPCDAGITPHLALRN